MGESPQFVYLPPPLERAEYQKPRVSPRLRARKHTRIYEIFRWRPMCLWL